MIGGRGAPADDAAVLGIDLGREELAEGGGDFVVLPENWDAVRLCCAVQSQWRYGPSGRPTGLDYTACAAAATWMDLEPGPELFDGLRVMEAEILGNLSKR